MGIINRYWIVASLLRAVLKAEKAFNMKKPDIIIASGGGCLVACRLQASLKDGEQVPMLLLNPINEMYHEKTGSSMPDLRGVPYTIVVHAIRDKKVQVSS